MPHYQCTRCTRSSLVKSNFKFTPQRICVCVVCWDKIDDARSGVIEAMGGMNARPTYSEERSMLEREYRHAGERFEA